MSQQHPSDCMELSTEAASQILESPAALPQWFPKGAGAQPFTPFQAPQVSTFGFPERLKKVTQRSTAAPNLTAVPPGPPHLSLSAAGHRHRRPRPRNKRVGKTPGSGPLGRRQSQCTPNRRTLSPLSEFPSTRIL